LRYGGADSRVGGGVRRHLLLSRSGEYRGQEEDYLTVDKWIIAGVYSNKCVRIRGRCTNYLSGSAYRHDLKDVTLCAGERAGRA
jgi:hypothetical protein